MAGLDQFAQRAERIPDGRRGIRLMKLVQIDVIGSEAAQAVLDSAAHIVGFRAVSVGIHFHAELRRNDDVFSAASQGPAEEFFAPAFSVDVGRVEEADAGVERSLNNRRRGLCVNSPSEVVTAEACQRYFQRSDASCLHLYFPL